MKIWKVDSYCIGPAVDAELDNTNDLLADILTTYEKQEAMVREILEPTKGNFRIIYTVENDSKSYGI